MFPKIAVLFTSYRCNSKCIMCSAWEKQQTYPELSIQQIADIFSDRILRNNLEIVNLTGGEPTLREDLVDIIKVLIHSCSRLRRIDIPTNGINTEQVIDNIERIAAFLLTSNVKLNITVSVDGVGGVHETIRGVSDIFDNIDRTIRELKEISELYPFLSLEINTTISRANITGLKDMRAYARSLGVGINFTLAAISEIGVESIVKKEKFEISNKEKTHLVSFFESLMQEKAVSHTYGKFVVNWLTTGKRRALCNFRRGKVFLLEPDGQVYLCGNFKDFRIGNVLDEPFEKIWRKSTPVLKRLSHRCSTCVSNCYLDL